MGAQSPEAVHHLFMEAFNRGDLDGLMALYEPGATLVSQPGQTATGVQAIKQALSGFLAVKGVMDIQLKKVLRAGDLAQILSIWTLKGTGPDGMPLKLNGQTTDVVRRQSDGSWRLAIDNPYAFQAVGE
jgi:uncharacterized protein (TIGR02246 family)